MARNWKLPLITAALLLVAGDANAAPKTLRVHAQVPRPPGNMKTLEAMGKAPDWQGGMEIPYDTLEKELNAVVKKALGKKKSGTAVCTDPCPDVEWSIKLKAKAKFTEKGQPKLKVLGRGGKSAKVQASVVARVRIDIHADVHAETWANSADVDVDAFVEIGAEVTATVSLWPKVKIDAFDSKFTLEDTDLSLELNDVAAELGTEIGFQIGATPFGIMGGGPLAIAGFLTLLGDAAAEVAEDKIEEMYAKRVAKAFNDAVPQIQKELRKELEMGIDSADDLISSTYEADLPGIGKSVSELSNDFGADLHLYTVQDPDRVHVSAVARFDGKPGAGKVRAKIRIPTQVPRCVKAGGVTLPVGLVTVNEDLEQKIGASCSEVLGPDGTNRKTGVETRVYLGANPRTALGNKAPKLESWKSAGSVKYLGTLSRARGSTHYVCTAEVSKLPDAAFIEVSANGRVAERLQVGKDAPRDRYAIYGKAGTTAVVDDAWKPTTVRVNGASSCGANGSPPALNPSQATEFLQFLENCPQCGVKRKSSDPSTLTIDNLSALKGHALGKVVAKKLKALQKAAK